MGTLEMLKWFFLALILLAPVLYFISSSFRYTIKMTLYYVIVFIATHISFFFIVPFYGDVSNFKTLSRIFLFCCKIFNIKWELRGAENLKSDKPFVIVCNHQSSLDFMGMAQFWPERCVSMAKSSLKYLGVISIVANACGTVFIERFNKDKAIETMGKVADRIKREQIKIWIFPEGTRHHEIGMLPFKKGAFHLAVQGQIPIVPVVFSAYSFFYSKPEKRFLSKGYVLAEALKPISTEGLTSDDVTDLSVKTRETMLKVYEKLSIEAAKRYDSGNY